MNQNINLNELNITQLKSLGYDCLVQLQIIQQNLNLINQEINKKSQNQPIQQQIFEPLPPGAIQSV